MMAQKPTYEELADSVRDLQDSVAKMACLEVKLRESENKYRQLVENANDAILILQDGMIKFMNQKTSELTGYTADELPKMPFIDLVHPEDREMVMDRHLRRLRGEELSSTYSFRVVHKTGRVDWGQVNAVTVDWQGKKSVLCFVRNVTERKQTESALRRTRYELENLVEKRTHDLTKVNEALGQKIEEHQQTEEALRRSERKYRMLFNSAQDGVLVLNSEGNIIDVSQGSEKLYGYSASDMLGRHFFDFVAPAFIPLFRERFEDFRQLKSADEEIQIMRSDGTTTDVWCKCTPFTDPVGNFEGVLIHDREITRIKILREQLIRSERLAATGQLAASIAHEINSPLQGVIGLIDVMKKSHATDQKLLKNLTLLEGAFDSIARTVRNLLDLNRPGKHLLQTVDVNRVIENTLALVRSTLKKNKVRTLLLLSAQIPGIIATPRQISQVIINLVNNAVEAMTGSRHNDHWYSFDSKGREITFTTYPQDDRVVIEVADNGPGISEEDLLYIFDPFYTSKKKLGMGVGLTICHGIVEEYSGTIVAGNSPTGGAVFTIEFPIR